MRPAHPGFTAPSWGLRKAGVDAQGAVQGPGAARPATMAEVEELLKEGKRLGLQLRGLPRLISMMAQARSFNMRARRALKRGAVPALLERRISTESP